MTFSRHHMVCPKINEDGVVVLDVLSKLSSVRSMVVVAFLSSMLWSYERPSRG